MNKRIEYQVFVHQFTSDGLSVGVSRIIGDKDRKQMRTVDEAFLIGKGACLSPLSIVEVREYALEVGKPTIIAVGTSSDIGVCVKRDVSGITEAIFRELDRFRGETFKDVEVPISSLLLCIKKRSLEHLNYLHDALESLKDDEINAIFEKYDEVRHICRNGYIVSSYLKDADVDEWPFGPNASGYCTSYFTVPKEVLGILLPYGDYKNAASGEIMLEYKTSMYLPFVESISVSASPTNADGEDYDWNDINLSDEDIKFLLALAGIYSGE